MTFIFNFGILVSGDIMIFDTLENIKNYEGLGRVYTALEFLAKTDFKTMELGRYELDGDNIYYMRKNYYELICDLIFKSIYEKFLCSGKK